ncbi:putative target SNARE coiled-coil domain-containing protein [Medicago truncatula]|uniref:Putative target SNARE coiled-coil domain-containing protein n=1 Tax=Medicago truncatula TaxID=3880 RepID=A0A396JBP3_MEDTR|nr:putative target SNARE coiled-coil domain-containing protein [Medicago truncatula]
MRAIDVLKCYIIEKFSSLPPYCSKLGQNLPECSFRVKNKTPEDSFWWLIGFWSNTGNTFKQRSLLFDLQKLSCETFEYKPLSAKHFNLNTVGFRFVFFQNQFLFPPSNLDTVTLSNKAYSFFNVANATDHVKSGNDALHTAKSLQKKSRKCMMIAIILVLLIAIFIVLGVVKPWKK